MLRSLLNSARGRSALTTPLPYEYPTLGPATVPATIHRMVVKAAPKPPAEGRLIPAPPAKTVTMTADAPRACCVHCGHPLFVPPKAVHVRCPKCSSDLPARDIELTGEVTDEQIITAGKITVAPGARVNARLAACSVDIAGMVLGTVLASHACRLRPTAKLAGNLLCRRLTLESGAQVEGGVELIRD
jgi:hypothetical protein